MKKIAFLFLVLTLIFLVSCSNEGTQDSSENLEENSEDIGYVNDLDDELDTSDLDSLDEDLNLDWV